MISTRPRPPSKYSTPKRIVAPINLAERFLEVQQLRKQVHDLERLATMDRQQAFTAKGGGSRDKRAE